MIALKPMSVAKPSEEKEPLEVRFEKEIETKEAPEPKPKFPLWEKIRKVKYIEIYFAVAMIAIMIGIYVSTFDWGGRSNQTQTVAQMTSDYARNKEQRLVSTLSQVEGAGRVSAMVTVVGSSSIEIAYSIDERTVQQGGPNGTTTTTVVRTPILTNGREPVVLFTTKPRVVGIVIVATGANDPWVRNQLLRSVQALVLDNSVRIEIITGR